MGDIVQYPSNGATSEGYLAVPADGGGPGVIVIQEWWGLVPHIRSVADRFADAGFVALAPDLYHGIQTTEPDEAVKLIMGLAMDQAAKDIAGAAEFLAGRSEVPGRIATVGFYPGMPWERMSPKWSNYAGKVALIHCDGHAPSASPGIQAARQAIEGAGGEVVLHDYPGSAHAFFNDDRPEVYNGEAAASAWARTVELFRTR